MKIIIAPDSLKGSITAIEAAFSIEKGVKNAFPEAETVLIPVADGGEGTMDTLVSATNGREVSVGVTGPLGQPINAKYGVLGDKKTCIIEMATASGLNLINDTELNPLKTTTYGTGELIKTALDEGYRNFIIALGGSATNDGGAGMLQALGIQLLDETNIEIGFGGGELNQIQKVNLDNFDERIYDSQFLIASDVENPLLGAKGATYVFGPQKGATEKMIQTLENNLTHWAELVENLTGKRLHDLEGAGAAGGLGGSLQAFFPSTIKRGVDVVIEYANLVEHLDHADLVITCEGQVDFQTVFGKTPMGVAQAANTRNVPTIIFAGTVGDNIQALYQYGVISVHGIINRPMSLEKAMNKASKLLEQTAEQVCRTYFLDKTVKKDH
ncbi:glycerate kinase [Pseudogracilibacillus sp. SO30301A]|uniref:glycerate kinase n=1 Tax=Pseudogracilibacillus sp. SO30301A TaxID=3098291 RepID=UPI00300E656D